MEGSSVRGQKKNLVVQLNEVQSLENFQAEIIKLLESEFKHVEILFGIVDAETNVLQLPAWIKSHLERQPGRTCSPVG